MSESCADLAQWRCCDRDALLIRSWDGECVVYDERSGSTHLLSGEAGRILTTLATSPRARSTLELVNIIAPADAASAPAIMLDVAAMLLELERLGLVQKVP